MQHTSANVMWFAGVLSEHSALSFYTDISVTITLLCRGAQSWRLFVSSGIRAFCREHPAVLLFYGPVSSLQTLRLPWFNILFFSKIKWPLETNPHLGYSGQNILCQKKKKLNDVCFLFQCHLQLPLWWVWLFLSMSESDSLLPLVTDEHSCYIWCIFMWWSH